MELVKSELVVGSSASAMSSPNVYLAPMVDGSEGAFRLLCRQHGIKTCYTPMLRDSQIIKLLSSKSLTPPPRIIPNDRPLIVQLCGRQPSQLAAAAKALLTHYNGQIDGIDLNLGCPQEIASKEGIGAYLAEDQALTCECVQALKEAVKDCNISIPISCKIRLVTPNTEEEEKKEKDIDKETAGEETDRPMDTVIDTITVTSATIAFAKRLQAAGCDLLAVHCRSRLSKHNGLPDLVTGAALVKALDIPVIINGGISNLDDVHNTLRITKAHGVMIAQGLLTNHRLLYPTNTMDTSVQTLAAEYLDFCEKILPPSPYYIRKHLRWMFRAELQGPSPNASKQWKKQWQSEPWRNKLWHLISRNNLTSLWQFRQMIHLYCIFSKIDQADIPLSVSVLDYPTFKSIRYKKGKRGNGKLRKNAVYSYQHLN